MNFSALIKARTSIRGYLPKPIPRELIDEIIEVAKWAPSSMNTQPWYVHVITGEPLERIRQGNTENMMNGVPHQRDFPENGKWPLRFNCLRRWALTETTRPGAPIG